MLRLLDHLESKIFENSNPEEIASTTSEQIPVSNEGLNESAVDPLLSVYEIEDEPFVGHCDHPYYMIPLIEDNEIGSLMTLPNMSSNAIQQELVNASFDDEPVNENLRNADFMNYLTEGVPALGDDYIDLNLGDEFNSPCNVS